MSIPILITKNQTRIEPNFQNWKLELELESTFFEELNWEPDLCGNCIPINQFMVQSLDGFQIVYLMY